MVEKMPKSADFSVKSYHFPIFLLFETKLRDKKIMWYASWWKPIVLHCSLKGYRPVKQFVLYSI